MAEPIIIEILDDTPPPTPRAAGGSGLAKSPLVKKSPAATNAAAAEPSDKARGKRKAAAEQQQDAGETKFAKPPDHADTDDDDDENMCVEITDPNADAAAAAAAAVAPDEDEDADVQYAGRTGDIALSDFPHSRENCLESLWKPGNEKHACPNCYCYVCDKPVSECPEWDEHCMATNTQQKWISMRALWKQHGGKPPFAPAGGASSSALANPNGSRQLTAEERPIEVSEPNHFTKDIKLRPYQRQSLAFMQQIESSTDMTLRGLQTGTGRHIRGGWLCDEMGMGKTAVCAALCFSAKDTATGGLTLSSSPTPTSAGG